MWLTDSECSGIISKAWACNLEGTPMFVVTKKLEKMYENVESMELRSFWKCAETNFLKKKKKKNQGFVVESRGGFIQVRKF